MNDTLSHFLKFILLIQFFCELYSQAYPPDPSSPVQVITGYQLPVYNYQVFFPLIENDLFHTHTSQLWFPLSLLLPAPVLIHPIQTSSL